MSTTVMVPLLTDALLVSRIPLSRPQTPLIMRRWERKDLEDLPTIASFDEGHIVTNPNASRLLIR